MHLDLSYPVFERMQTLGISDAMVAQALNAPVHVRRLPLSQRRSYYCEFAGRTLRVMTTLDERVLTVSWTAH